MNIKRIIAVVLAALTVVSVLGACGNGAASVVPSSINEDGRFVYTVVRSGEEGNVAAEDGAKAIRSAIKDNFDCNVTITKDTAYEDFDGNYEIVVGDTLREESAEAKQRIIDNRPNHASDFIVAVIDDKICIQAIEDDMLTVAVEWFIATFCKDLTAWSQLRSDYEFIYQPEATSSENKIADTDLGLFTTVIPRVATYMEGMGAEEFADHFFSYGYSVTQNRDDDGETAYEILFGNCDRQASESVTVEGDNYVIKVVGTKLVIKGGSDLATWRGAKAFLDELYKAEESGVGFNWTDGYTINGKYDPEEEGTYTFNWGDEFNDSTIDLTKWSDYNNGAKKAFGESSLGGTIYYAAPNGDCAYTGSGLKKLIYQSDGSITLASQRIDKDFINTRFATFNTMMYKYGIFEIKGKLSDTPATVSYWFNGAAVDGRAITERFGDQTRGCMTEVDLLENFGNNSAFNSNVHRWWTEYKADGTSKGSRHNSMDGNAMYTGNSKNNKRFNYDTEKYGETLADDYHVYTYYWDDKCMKFIFDGKVFCDYQYTDNMSVSVHCLMNYFLTNCSMGNPAYGATYDKDIHKDYYEHKIDWIRLYQTDSINSQLITAWPQDQESGTAKVYYPENTIGGAY